MAGDVPWTPGPWVAHKYLGRDDNWFVRGLNDERVCGRGSGPIKGNDARLIAASPTMADYIAKRAQQGDAEARALLGVIHGDA